MADTVCALWCTSCVPRPRARYCIGSAAHPSAGTSIYATCDTRRTSFSPIPPSSMPPLLTEAPGFMTTSSRYAKFEKKFRNWNIVLRPQRRPRTERDAPSCRRCNRNIHKNTQILLFHYLYLPQISRSMYPHVYPCASWTFENVALLSIFTLFLSTRFNLLWTISERR